MVSNPITIKFSCFIDLCSLELCAISLRIHVPATWNNHEVQLLGSVRPLTIRSEHTCSLHVVDQSDALSSPYLRPSEIANSRLNC